MEGKISIKNWALEDRPREKLEALGPENLSEAELLAILIGSGSADESAVELMRRVLNDCNNNLNTLGKMSIAELTDKRYKGLGPAKAITILAACELGKRRQEAQREERPKILSSEDAYQIIYPIIQDKYTEEGWILLLNQAGYLIKKTKVSEGGLTETIADVRVILKEAILANATGLIFCHNHPSGRCQPSAADDRLTEQLAIACKAVRIPLRDHIIVTDGNYYSYTDEGKL